MTVTELLAQFANPEAMQQLTTAEKLNAGLATTLLGMGITFTALIALLFLISWFDKLINPKKKGPDIKLVLEADEQPTAPATQEVVDDKQIVAAITTALAVSLKTSVDNIVIRNIERVEDSSPAWNRAGIIEQMNSRL